MSVVYRPIVFDELASLVEIPNDLSDNSEALSEIIMIYSLFLTVYKDTVVFVYQSIKESLLKETQNAIFARGLEAKYCMIFSRCLQAMFKILRYEYFQLETPRFLIEKIILPSLNLLGAVKYLCIYWVDHLYYSGCYRRRNLDVDERGYKYLYWLEALSILGSLLQGIAAMLKLEGLLKVNHPPFYNKFKTASDSSDTIG
ncbi:hypothetical protein N7481_006358 [Penicillium waksmanii]|uniref:uncharacterized protein n=1 Tax=Penicillium waksmanii TaxID=69791 RepID=UPI002547CA93|nr:uncharacterized protein N7481_006358 [Penicillium waksmanii]KAJ5984259.1 hypothetical protein N7481_006358 [Penicillium waksmanii]